MNFDLNSFPGDVQDESAANTSLASAIDLNSFPIGKSISCFSTCCYIDIFVSTTNADNEVLPDLNEVLHPFELNEHWGYQAKNTTKQQRDAIYSSLLERSHNGKLFKNCTRLVSVAHNVSIRTVQRIWDSHKKCKAAGVPVNIQSKRPENCGRKKVTTDLGPVADIPLTDRSTIRALAQKIGMKKSTVHNRLKQGMLRRHSNALKPLLKAGNMTERLRWCLSMLDEDGLPNNPKFKCMDNIIHLDEKWFNMTKKARNFYLLPTEEDPYRTVQNKNFINKIMFLSAVSLPHYDADGNCTFDGKIGVWPFVRKVP